MVFSWFLHGFGFATASIYLQCLQQAQLPWSQPPPAAELNTVLEATRDAQTLRSSVRSAESWTTQAGW
ncbi:MAG: hypothetical protein QOF51_2468 [Chloroflexota bacterium]|nr:hypothetical protein [Chloroflexota bacterium]